MLPIRNIFYLSPMCCSFWEKFKNSPKSALGCSTPLRVFLSKGQITLSVCFENLRSCMCTTLVFECLPSPLRHSLALEVGDHEKSNIVFNFVVQLQPLVEVSHKSWSRYWKDILTFVKNLKGYSVILTTYFYDMNQKVYKQKKLASQI